MGDPKQSFLTQNSNSYQEHQNSSTPEPKDVSYNVLKSSNDPQEEHFDMIRLVSRLLDLQAIHHIPNLPIKEEVDWCLAQPKKDMPV